jgi:polysaccharide deacetylase 2 family uncharacterized protein YibQ
MSRKRTSPRRPRKRKSDYDRRVLIGIVVAAVVLGLLLWGPPLKKELPERARRMQPKKHEQIEKKPEARKAGPEERKGRGKSALVALVIDDLGQDLKLANEVIALHRDITIAVLPRLSYSPKIAAQARQAGREVLLHLPMERKNLNGKPLAPGTLRSDMTPLEFIETLQADIESVPGAAGVSNHEGSALTENREAMKFLMAELKDRDVFFIDSLTDPKSAAFSTAREFGIKAGKRDVFLDNDSSNAASIRDQLAELEELAMKRGSAIGIGHPHPATISELRKWLPQAEEKGIEIVPVSKLVK